MVRRYTTLVLGVLLSGTVCGTALGTGEDLLVAGQTEIAVIDGNGDGPGDGDCMFSASLYDSTFMIMSTQDTTTPLVVCDAIYDGTVGPLMSDESSNFFSLFMTNTMAVGALAANGNFGSLPMTIVPIEETGQPGDEDPPLAINQLELFDGDTSQRVGFGEICNAGGPAAKVTIANGSSMLVQLELVSVSDGANSSSSTNGSTYVKIPNLPLQTVAGGLVMRDAYIPVNKDGTATAGPESDPDYVMTDLTALPSCGRKGAPTATEWGLVALALGLLGLGAWALSRRQTFRASLPAF